MTDKRFLPHALIAYFLIVYLVNLGIVSSFTSGLEIVEAPALAFTVLAILSYPLLYLLPSLVLTTSLSLMLLVQTRPAVWKTLVICATACFSATGTILFLAADRYLFRLYGFHFNAFVWNLITTPGGIDSLGSTAETQLWIGITVLLALTANGLLLWLCLRRQSWRRRLCPPRRYLLGGALLLLLFLAAHEGGYAFVRFTNNEPYLKAASIIPLHLDTTAEKLFKKAGVERPATQEQIRIAKGEIRYPLHPLQTRPLAKYPNIVWLTAESFRWDLFSPEITPNLWKFSQRAVTFNRHYSGGNRTRMGMFSMFYGLYAPYWYGFQEQKIAPQMMQQVTANNYQIAAHTSQSFTYPELVDTVFAGVPPANLQELKNGPSWQRDSQNISDISRFIQVRDPKRPFFTFMFFESTHAPYNFPESAVIRPDYLQQVNYLQMNNFTGNIEKLHDRYINAAHHVDAEVGRLLDLLEKEQLLDDTIVLFTGDHGEEFMENGHWGHGHNEVFPETQIRVPLVLWIPGQKPQQIDYPTSHNQIPATILPYLGVTSPARDYCSEESLFATPRPYRVIGSYDYLAIVDAQHKLSFPFTTAQYFRYIYSDNQDGMLPVRQQQELLQEKRPQLEEVTAECSRFTAKTRELAAHADIRPQASPKGSL
jgi:membrane-anchored protein YejM (alkaline phosphatase superfamily)